VAGCIIHREGCSVQIARAEQSDQSVPEVVALEKDKDGDETL
jgi:hypothetical protein